jgi:hypothetical protein
MKYYKFLTANHTGEYSNFDYSPYLPHDGQPGDWLPEIPGELKMCERGYHATDAGHLANWINAELYEVELGRTITGEGKIAGASMRFLRRIDTWNARTARLFAVWCARQALKLVDNPDPHSIAACDTAERYANGTATADELSAARDAAWAAARDAARVAAWDAARAAAWDAARAAAWAAARAAQSEKLIEMLEIGG